MWRTVHAAAKDVVRDWKVGAGGLRVLSFATFVEEGAMVNVLLKPKVNVTRTTLMLGDRIFHPYANCISCILKQCTL